MCLIIFIRLSLRSQYLILSQTVICNIITTAADIKVHMVAACLQLANVIFMAARVCV